MNTYLLVNRIIWAAVLGISFYTDAQELRMDENEKKINNESAAYKSPYSVNFTFSSEELIGDILSGRRGASETESSISSDCWDSAYVRSRYGAWGPPARRYPIPGLSMGKGIEWKRERIIAVGLRFIGYPYQHHHVPDWSPPVEWPWKKVVEGKNTKGVDCSNFTAFVYNLALGVHLSSDICKQSEELCIPAGLKREFITAERIDKPELYEDCKNKFRTGDLLFIKSGEEVSHVIMWLGEIGRSPDNVPLILDSTGPNHKDCNGVKIPNGVHLRPFTEKSWYFKSLSHATRIIK